MTIATPLVNAARKLINDFGNTAILYPIADATTSFNDEGDLSITSWATATTANTIKVVDGGNQGVDLTQMGAGFERIGDDEKIVKDNITVAVRDRLAYDGQNYKVVGLRAERVESTDIIQIVKVVEATNITNW